MQPGGRDCEEERSVARLNLKCQMLYFDFMEKKDSSENPTDHMLPSIFPYLLEKEEKKSQKQQVQTGSFTEL